MQNQSGPLLTTQVLAIIFSRSKHFYFLKALCRSYHQCHKSHRHRWSQPETQDTIQIQIHPRIQEMKIRFNFQLISPSCSSMDQSWVCQKDSHPEIKLFLQNNILNKSIYGHFQMGPGYGCTSKNLGSTRHQSREWSKKKLKYVN